MLRLLLAIVCLYLQSSLAESHLAVTALISDEHDDARFQCWQFSKPFSTYPTVGKAISLADVSNLTYVVLPPRSEEGIHKPPHAMFFVLLAGQAHVTLPDGSDELWIGEGVNGFMIAADTRGIGHYTAYPSEKETIALQIPFAEGGLPPYEVLHQGTCAIPATMQDKTALSKDKSEGNRQLPWEWDHADWL